MRSAEQGKLSRDEVEALLQATREDTTPKMKPEPARRIEGYNFHQPSRFNKAQLEKLRRINDELAQQVARQTSRLLRSSVQVQLISMDHIKWDNLLQEVGETAAAYTFTMEPFGYQGLVTIDSQFAVACLERMLGGTGADGGSASEFTEMDARVLGLFASTFLDPLPELWNTIGEFHVQMGEFVSELQRLDVFTGSEDFFQTCFLVQSSVGSGQVALSAPFQAVRHLPPDAEEEQPAMVAADSEADEGLKQSLTRTPVELTVLLGEADVTMARLVRARPGDVVVLNTRVGDVLEVQVNGVPKFKAHPGVSDGHLAVKLITEE